MTVLRIGYNSNYYLPRAPRFEAGSFSLNIAEAAAMTMEKADVASSSSPFHISANRPIRVLAGVQTVIWLPSAN